MNVPLAKKIGRLAQKALGIFDNILTTPRLMNKAKSILRSIDINIASSVPETLKTHLDSFAEKNHLSIKQKQWMFFEALKLNAWASGTSFKKFTTQQTIELAGYILKNHILDPLTNTFTRKTLSEETQYRRHGSVLFFDLNGFKALNDKHGHDAGDDALKYFSNILKTLSLSEEFQKADIDIYRNGGDEFVIFIEGDKNKNLAKDFARAVHNELKQKPFEYNSQKPPLDTSIGISTYNSKTPVSEALSRADQSMYRNKTERKSKIQNGETELPSFSTKPLLELAS